jgi:hypothetical protein
MSRLLENRRMIRLTRRGKGLAMTVRIRVYENSAYQDEDAAYTLAGEFTPDEALRRSS